ncbi:MAG TPA: response regulator [Steroidobacteraceae bacterium]|nr:response regulator [Steroidobacteraceae bacterium]
MAKRALVVDDSNSARMLLSRMLEKYAIEVDNAESAEQALEYLGHHRPDVIFMDHMMPGMDGLQAVRTIKNNPRTATIPILMYTSQEGELYVGQARALGAVGVLPKQIKPADVSKVLYQLHLLPERRTGEQQTFELADGADDGEPYPKPPAGKPLTDAALREQFADLRRTLVANLDSHSERLKAELRALLAETPSAPPSSEPLAKPGAPWSGIIAAVAGVVAVVSLGIASQQAVERRALTDELSQLRALLAHPAALSVPAAARTASSAAAGTAAGSAPAGDPSATAAPLRTSSTAGASATASRRTQALAKPIIELVPYGEDPLSGARLDPLRQLFDRLVAQGYHGTVDIKVFPGRFCLVGNPNDGFSLAPDETAYSQCDAVGTVADDSLPPSPRVSLAFADLAAAVRSASHGAVDVQVETGDAATTLVAYPAVSATLTAGDWNRAGSANNRIEIRVR